MPIVIGHLQKVLLNRFWLLGLLCISLMCGCSGRENKKAIDLSPKDIFSNNCASCHGGNLQGGLGPSLSHIGSSLSKQDILTILNNGRGAMRPQLHLPEQDKEKLANWLYNNYK